MDLLFSFPSFSFYYLNYIFYLTAFWPSAAAAEREEASGGSGGKRRKRRNQSPIDRRILTAWFFASLLSLLSLRELVS